MVTVPRYGEPKVELRPLQAGRVNPEVTPDMLGAGRAAQSVFAQAKGLVSDVAQIQEQGEQFQFGMEKQKIQEEMQIAEHQIKRANAEKEFEFQRLANTFETNILEEMIAKNKGKNSYTLLDVAPKAFDQYVNDTMVPLAFNDEQKQSMRIVSDTYRMRMNSKLHGYVASQIDAERELSYKANVASFVDAGIRNSNDKAAWAGSIGDLIGATRLYADEKGLPSEVYEQLLQSNLTSLHKGVIENYLSTGAYAAADKYLNENEKGMDPQVVSDLRPHVVGSVKKSREIGEIYRLTDEITASGGTLEDALLKVRKVNPEYRDGVDQRVKEYYSDLKVAEKVAYDNLLDQAQKQMADRGSDFFAVDPYIQDSLDPKDAENLKTIASNIRLNIIPPRGGDSYSRWVSLSTEEKAKRELANIVAYRGVVPPEEYDHILHDWKSSRMAVAGDKESKRLQSNSKYAYTQLMNYEVDPSDASILMSSIQDKVTEWEGGKKKIDLENLKKLTKDTANEYFRELAKEELPGTEVSIPSGWLFVPDVSYTPEQYAGLKEDVINRAYVDEDKIPEGWMDKYKKRMGNRYTTNRAVRDYAKYLIMLAIRSETGAKKRLLNR